MKKIALIYTLVISIFIIVSIHVLNKDAVEAVDMSQLNQRYMQITEELENDVKNEIGYDIENDIDHDSNTKKDTMDGNRFSIIEQKYACQIYLNTDTDYDKKVRDSVKNEDIMLDFSLENADEQTYTGKIAFADRRNVWNRAKSNLRLQFLIISCTILLSGYLLMAWIYYFYIRPFHKLKTFADNVARGELDTPLTIHKNNYFGAFTESFDMMREQLKEARQNEYNANVRKKELVAELSHDMKTPLATIKATCEVLKTKLEIRQNQISKQPNELKDNQINPSLELQDYEEKVDIIDHKTDTINQLISNMFHATLEELEVLKVEPVLCESVKLNDILSDISDYETIELTNQIPECLVYMDLLRFKQVVDNIVNNSFKYAKTPIHIKFQEQADGITIEIRDFGQGVAEEELASVTGKFYRGSNAKGKDGTGLGLFLAKYFMEQMNGGFECFNDNGFVVVLYLKKG